MIRDIEELNFPSYATLSQASVNINDMGERTITADIEIDGNIAPDFSYDWEVLFRNEKYIMPSRKPEASKDNTSKQSNVQLVFYHWVVYELKRYFFVEMASISSSTAIPDKYETPLGLTLPDFIRALNQVLNYHFRGRIRAELYEKWDADNNAILINISYTYIWDLLASIFEKYSIRWQIEAGNDGQYIIKFGYPTTSLEHVFAYGFNGGLMKVARQVQSADVRNILLGRGGEKNLPYRYFKDIDPQNPSFQADPDWIPELSNIYFSELRDAAFRSYVQGWKARHYGGTVTKEQAAVDWAYERGYRDREFQPVEYVKDDKSIQDMGELWGAVEKNEDISPTIQGIEIAPFGRIDEVVHVEEIPESEDAGTGGSTVEVSQIVDASIVGVKAEIPNVAPTTEKSISRTFLQEFAIPSGKKGNVYPPTLEYQVRDSDNTWNETMKHLVLVSAEYRVKNIDTGKMLPVGGIPEGRYQLVATITARNNYAAGGPTVMVVVSLGAARLETAFVSDAQRTDVFHIWVKNLWGTTKGNTESASDYAERVWRPILGDDNNNEAKVVFSDGWLGISEDYEFAIVDIPEFDTSYSLGGVSSHWKLKLARSDAEMQTMGKLLPNSEINAQPGDHFFLNGIDLPYLYYTEAEKRLTAYKKGKLAEVTDVQYTWVVSLDRVRISQPHYNESVSLLENIVVGASIKLTDKRFNVIKDEDGNIVEAPPVPLYVSSITYTYRKPTSQDAALNPDVEIVLSSSYATQTSPIALLQGEVDTIRTQVGYLSNLDKYLSDYADQRYLRKDTADIAYGSLAFAKTIHSTKSKAGTENKVWSITNAGEARFEKLFAPIAEYDNLTSTIIKAVDLTASNIYVETRIAGAATTESGEMPWYITGGGLASFIGVYAKDFVRADEVSSKDFVSGFAGHGYRITPEVAEFQDLIVNGSFNVYELIVQKVQAVGGNLCISPATAKITEVVEVEGGWKCYLETMDGILGQPFVTGDNVLCQVFNGSSIKRYWRRVTVAGKDDGVQKYYIKLSKTLCEANSDIPEAGDELVLFGNNSLPNKTERQSAIMLSAYGTHSPYIAYYAGLKEFTTEGTEIMREGKLSGITDADFGTLEGTGFFCSNAYIKGTFHFRNGTNVETYINDTVAAMGTSLGTSIQDINAQLGLMDTTITDFQVTVDGLQSTVTNITDTVIPDIQGDIADIPNNYVTKTEFTQTANEINLSVQTNSVAAKRYALGQSWGSGKSLFNDPSFASGYNGIIAYQGTTLTRAAKDEGSPIEDSGFNLFLTTNSGASVGSGGFVQIAQSRKNAIFLHRFVAKADIGVTFQPSSNLIGTGYSRYWCTSNEGTGKWEEYIYATHCGSEGTFGTFGHVYVDGRVDTNVVLAYSNIYDITDGNAPVGAGNIVNSINLSTEGIRINASKLEISGETIFRDSKGNNVHIFGVEDNVLSVNGGVFAVKEDGKVYMSNAEVKGHIIATSAFFDGNIRLRTGAFSANEISDDIGRYNLMTVYPTSNTSQFNFPIQNSKASVGKSITIFNNSYNRKVTMRLNYLRTEDIQNGNVVIRYDIYETIFIQPQETVTLTNVATNGLDTLVTESKWVVTSRHIYEHDGEDQVEVQETPLLKVNGISRHADGNRIGLVLDFPGLPPTEDTIYRIVLTSPKSVQRHITYHVDNPFSTIYFTWDELGFDSAPAAITIAGDIYLVESTSQVRGIHISSFSFDNV